MPGEATMPAMRRISEYSSSVSGQTVRRVFLRNLILRSNLFSRNSASVTWRGKRSMARIGFGTAAAHYGLTTQHRKVIFVVTPVRLRAREVGESRVRIVNLSAKKFFGFES